LVNVLVGVDVVKLVVLGSVLPLHSDVLEDVKLELLLLLEEDVLVELLLLLLVEVDVLVEGLLLVLVLVLLLLEDEVLDDLGLLVEVDVDVVLVGVVLEDVDEDKLVELDIEVLEEVEELMDASARGCGGARTCCRGARAATA